MKITIKKNPAPTLPKCEMLCDGGLNPKLQKYELTKCLDKHSVNLLIGSAGAHNRTMGRIVSQEYKSRVGNFEDPSVLQQQMLVFFNSSDIMDIDGPLDPTEYPEGKQFLGKGEYEGKEYMVIAGNIVEL